MEALFQIVGCVASSKPAVEQIDEFVAKVRRERAVVINKDAQGATFVRFSAPDARLVSLACEAVLGQAVSSLRFGFASGVKEPALKGQDGVSVSSRSIAQAGELVAGARDGEVLVSPQLALLLIESGISLQSRQVQLPGGRTFPACVLDLASAVADPVRPDARPVLEGQVSGAPGNVYRGLMAQAGDVTRRQGELEARLDAAHGKAAPVADTGSSAARLGGLETELDARLLRLEDRLRFVDVVEQRLDKLQFTLAGAERKLADLQARHEDIDTLKQRCDALAEQLAGVTALQERLLPIATQVTTLQQSLEQLQQSLAAHQSRLTELDRSAEAVEQKIRALADREALVQAVKAEVENIRQISSRSKADLQFVTEHRSDVTELRGKVEALLERVHETDGKIATIESRRKTVEEVQQRADAITHMLGDINVNLEMLSEQRAVIDHVGEKLARLDFTVQEAQNTLRALQREREVAERIEQGIKALRSGSGANRLG